jgi:hypothetical protein
LIGSSARAILDIRPANCDIEMPLNNGNGNGHKRRGRPRKIEGQSVPLCLPLPENQFALLWKTASQLDMTAQDIVRRLITDSINDAEKVGKQTRLNAIALAESATTEEVCTSMMRMLSARA